MEITPLKLAERFVGLKEVPGIVHNPAILAMLRLDQEWPESDEVPWCSAFMNYIAWLLRLPRSKSLLARSWLDVGDPILYQGAIPGWDILILSRGSSPNQGHVGFFVGHEYMSGQGQGCLVLGGNQSNQVKIDWFPLTRILGARRLAP